LGWAFRKHHPKYVSKIELGKGIPSVSFNLNHGGSVLIDRKDAKQSLRAIIGLGKYIEEHNRSAVIFPEGTRSRNGVPKRFSENGVKMLVRSAPSALIVPVTINNSWKLTRYGNFPLGTGVHLTLDVHEPIDPTTMSFEDMMTIMEETIKRAGI
jgi:1-acyl-sn-glycerol-3-phosphate acyltransferase